MFCCVFVCLLDNKVGGEGATALAEAWKSCPELRDVDLFCTCHMVMCHASSHEADRTRVAGNPIDDNGYLALASAFKSCTQLIKLDLKGG